MLASNLILLRSVCSLAANSALMQDWPRKSTKNTKGDEKALGKFLWLDCIALEKPSMLCFFTVVYSLGLRLQEALYLQVTDIDSKRMMVHIHRGKGAKDRMVPLPESVGDCSVGATVLGSLRIPSCDQQQPNRQGRTRRRWHLDGHVHVSPKRYKFVQAYASECRGIHTSVLATCASERISKSPSLRLRPSSSQDELGVVVDVGNGDTEHGVCPDSGGQAADGEANVKMPGMRW